MELSEHYQQVNAARLKREQGHHDRLREYFDGRYLGPTSDANWGLFSHQGGTIRVRTEGQTFRLNEVATIFKGKGAVHAIAYKRVR